MKDELEELLTLVARNCTMQQTGYLHISKVRLEELIERIRERRKPETKVTK